MPPQLHVSNGLARPAWTHPPCGQVCWHETNDETTGRTTDIGTKWKHNASTGFQFVSLLSITIRNFLESGKSSILTSSMFWASPVERWNGASSIFGFTFPNLNSWLRRWTMYVLVSNSRPRMPVVKIGLEKWRNSWDLN